MTHYLLALLQPRIAGLAIALGLGTIPAFATENDFALCRQLFAQGRAPFVQHREEPPSRALCFSSFAVLYSGTSRTPVFVAEKLNKEGLLEAHNNQRTNKFYEETRLPGADRASLEDYKGSGFVRGHMAPAGDMASGESMAQSFSLANIVPQNPVNNRKTWAGIEKTTRKYVMRAAGDVFVITGPVFDDIHPTIGGNRVWVPQHLFKLVYDPATHRAWVNWLDNTATASVGKPISYDELVRRTGIQFLPVLD